MKQQARLNQTPINAWIEEFENEMDHFYTLHANELTKRAKSTEKQSKP